MPNIAPQNQDATGNAAAREECRAAKSNCDWRCQCRAETRCRCQQSTSRTQPGQPQTPQNEQKSSNTGPRTRSATYCRARVLGNRVKSSRQPPHRAIVGTGSGRAACRNNGYAASTGKTGWRAGDKDDSLNFKEVLQVVGKRLFKRKGGQLSNDHETFYLAPAISIGLLPGLHGEAEDGSVTDYKISHNSMVHRSEAKREFSRTRFAAIVPWWLTRLRISYYWHAHNTPVAAARG
jgi:hypothetical protein